jgi:hypothetical protein
VLVSLRYELAAPPARYAPASLFSGRAFAALPHFYVEKGRIVSDDEIYGVVAECLKKLVACCKLTLPR